MDKYYRVVASSTMVVEYIGIYEALIQGIRLKNFVARLRTLSSIKKSLKIFVDNKSIMLFSKSSMSLTKSKHKDMKYLVIKEGCQVLHVHTSITLVSEYEIWNILDNCKFTHHRNAA